MIAWIVMSLGVTLIGLAALCCCSGTTPYCCQGHTLPTHLYVTITVVSNSNPAWDVSCLERTDEEYTRPFASFNYFPDSPDGTLRLECATLDTGGPVDNSTCQSCDPAIAVDGEKRARLVICNAPLTGDMSFIAPTPLSCSPLHYSFDVTMEAASAANQITPVLNVLDNVFRCCTTASEIGIVTLHVEITE